MPDREIEPAPTGPEAAAIIAAVTAYLTEQRLATRPAPTPSLWAIAGRLASQGYTRRPQSGSRYSWRTISRHTSGN